MKITLKRFAIKGGAVTRRRTLFGKNRVFLNIFRDIDSINVPEKIRHEKKNTFGT